MKQTRLEEANPYPDLEKKVYQLAKTFHKCWLPGTDASESKAVTIVQTYTQKCLSMHLISNRPVSTGIHCFNYNIN